MITDELLFRFLNQDTNRKENLKIREWLSASPDHANRLDQLRTAFETSGQEANREELLNDWNSIDSKLKNSGRPLQFRPALSIRLARIAAVLLFLAGSGLLWWYQSNTHVIRNNDAYAKSVYLPDGTHVDLGPGSKLVYGREFLDSLRLVRLTGEAFFDVTSDPDHPFIVVAGMARIKVTGTKFVVTAPLRSEKVEVAVKSGIVLFYNSETLDRNSFRMGLVAGERGIFSPSLNRMDKVSATLTQSAP
jgi:transmembrane sensor